MSRVNLTTVLKDAEDLEQTNRVILRETAKLLDFAHAQLFARVEQPDVSPTKLEWDEWYRLHDIFDGVIDVGIEAEMFIVDDLKVILADKQAH